MSSDFGTQMGFTQMAAQGLQADPAPASSKNADDGEADAALAFATPTPRPEALAEESAAADAPAKELAVEAVVAAVAKPEAAQADSAPVDAVTGQKSGFFSALFGVAQEEAKPDTKPVKMAALVAPPAAAPEPVLQPVKIAQEQKPVIKVAASAYSATALPGVRGNRELFEIVRKSGTSDNSDVDLYEEESSYQLASVGGLARLAPHGLRKQRDDVDTSCFKPQLVRMLKTIERHYGKPVLVTSGYRNPEHNRRVRGATKSAHMACAAADIQVAGVSRWELARFARSIPSRGGVGTYCHTASVHVDVGSERDWNWRCRK